MITLYVIGALTTCEILGRVEYIHAYKNYRIPFKVAVTALTLTCLVWPIFWLYAVFQYKGAK